MTYAVIVYQLPEHRDEAVAQRLQRGSAIVVSRNESKDECRRMMRSFCGPGWTMNRRPDLHTWGETVITFVKEDKP